MGRQRVKKWVAIPTKARKRHVPAQGLDLPTAQSRDAPWKSWTQHAIAVWCYLTWMHNSSHCSLSGLLIRLAYRKVRNHVSGPSDSCTFHGQTGILLCTSIFMQSFRPGTRTWSLYYSTPTSWSLLAENQLVFPQLYCPLSHLNPKHWKYTYKENIHSEVLYLRS